MNTAAIGRSPKHRPACSRSSAKRSGAGTLRRPLTSTAEKATGWLKG
jgi:hypothetical protein